MKVFLLAMLLTLVSCAQHQVNQRTAQLKAELDPLMGQTEQAVILQMGQPQSVDDVSGIKIYKYHRSYGSRSTASAYGNYGTVNAYGQSWESYDQYSIYFQDGFAVKWDGYVQR